MHSTIGLPPNIENYEPEALNKVPEDFHAKVRKEDGKDYTSMAVRTAIERYLRGQGYKYSTIRNRESKGSKQVLSRR